VSEKRPRNMAASVRERLSQLAVRCGRPFQEVVQNFAMERFLHRLAVSPHAGRYILKGALMLSVWGGSRARPTKDIDLLGLEASDAEKVIEVFQAICLQPVEPDGLEFDPSTVACTPIRAAVKGLGLQVTLQGCLGSMRVAMQADIGYEDVIHPGPMQADYPALLDLPPPRLLGYTRETVVAEKLEAMVRLRMYNSRMKDFHDIGFLSANFSFEGGLLTEAIRRTFVNRSTGFPTDLPAFLERFAQDPQKILQWRAFVRRLPSSAAAGNLEDNCRAVSAFAGSPIMALVQQRNLHGTWHPGGPWLP